MKTLAVLITLIAVGAVLGIGESQTAKVRLHVVDQFGTGAGAFEVIEFLYGGPSGKDYSKMFRKGEAVDLDLRQGYWRFS
jgi:hypothetical protein